jgi:hypothetical protein
MEKPLIWPEIDEKIVAFFNQVADATEVVEYVERYSGNKIPILLADEILAKREIQPETCFKTYQDIISLCRGIGPKRQGIIRLAFENAEEIEARIITFFNLVNESSEINSLLKPVLNPIERRSDLANKILIKRETLPKRRFSSLRELTEIEDFALIFDDLITRFQNDQNISERYPVLLFPVRLETKLMGEKLCIRVYPDQLAIETHESDLTKAEIEAGHIFRKKFNSKVDGDQKRNAWRELARKFGSPRAAWIASVIDREDANYKAAESWTRAPEVRILPDRFYYYIYKDDKPFKVVRGKRILSPLPLIRIPKNELQGGPQLFDAASSWVESFDEAVNEGMAVRVQLDIEDLPPNSARYRIFTVGVKGLVGEDTSQRLLEELINNHHYTSGIEFPEYGTPTNNTSKEKAGNSTSEQDYDQSYVIEFGQAPYLSDESNAASLTRALGVKEEVFHHIRGATDYRSSYAREMQTAVWPATGDYFIRYMLQMLSASKETGNSISPEDRQALWIHFGEFVRARGHLPLLRIGNLPYGILPTTPFYRFPFDNNDEYIIDPFDVKLLKILRPLFAKWLEMAQSPSLVPRIGCSDDPDKELLQILSMEPGATSYHIRPYVDDRITGSLLYILREYLFSNPAFTAEEWVNNWGQTWNTLTDKIKNILRELGMDGLDNVQTPVLTRILGWGEGRPLPIQVTTDQTIENGDPREYFRELSQTVNVQINDSDPLLSRMLKQAIIYEGDLLGGKDSYVIPAIERLANPSVLTFFNQAQAPGEIAKRMRDDPRYGSGTETAYGMRLILATEILNHRNSLPGKRFKSLADIEGFRSISRDSLHDIESSLSTEAENLDLDGLFRDSLDLCSHRLDAWISSFAAKQLIQNRAKNPRGIYLGAYGWVDELQLISDNPTSNGYIHAPSLHQAQTAAILHNGYLTYHSDSDNHNPFCLNLSSERVRHALSILEGIRQGQELNVLLGYQFERGLHEREMYLEQYIDNFRGGYPIPISVMNDVSDVKPRDVVDGKALALDWRNCNGDLTQLVKVNELPSPGTEQCFAIIEELNALINALDGVTDLLITESVYQTLSGNYERAAVALDAASGAGRPPEIESILTPSSGTSFSHRVCMLFDISSLPPDGSGPRSKAEPRLAAWFNTVLGDLSEIKSPIRYTTVDENNTQQDVVNINTASKEELMCLPEIGDALAERIIAQREQKQQNNDEYHILESLIDVNGIGDETVKKIKESRLATAGPSKPISLSDLAIDALDVLYLSSTPPSGEESELDQRLAYILYKQGYSIDPQIHIHFDSSQDSNIQRNIVDAMELAGFVFRLLGKANPLRPESFTCVETADQAAYTSYNYQELYGRVISSKNDLNSLIEQLGAENISDDLLESLLKASRFGVLDSVPTTINTSENGNERKTDNNINRLKKDRVVKEIKSRIEKCNTLIEKATASASSQIYNDAISRLVEAMKALFGDSFIVLPELTFSGKDNFHNALLHQNEILMGKGEERIRLWLQQAAQTHPSVKRLDDVMMITDAWGAETPGKSCMNLKVAQLPFDKDQPWLALSNDERNNIKWPKGVMSIVSLAPKNLNDMEQVAGLLIDQWSELIPAPCTTTGISFHYNSPNAQAPQCLLLAVPKPKIEPGDWQIDDVLETVEDTFDLMKIRAVDLDAFQQVGSIFPALFLPVDPYQPGWQRVNTIPLISQWFAATQDP